ncbi:MAG: RNA polymerase sigma factor [Acidobacteria bacterium]|nr:RNA polymerase sigma factor [Acidobacteriota bacterium]
MDTDSSVELIRRAQSGDEDALGQLFERHLPDLRRWAHGRLPQFARDLADTHDLVQDAMKRTVMNFTRFEYRGEGALRAYLHQAVVNQVYDHVRRVGRRPLQGDLEEGLADGGRSPLEAAIDGQTRERFEAAMAQLAVDDQQAVRARLEQGLSYDEIATLVGKPSADAARMAVARAVKRLATLMAATSGQA